MNDKSGNGNRRAFVTLLSSPSYAVGVLALAYSLKRVGSAHQLVCLCTKDISPEMRVKICESGGVSA